MKTPNAQNKLPFFIRLKSNHMIRLREIAAFEKTTITQIIEDSLAEHLPKRKTKWVGWKK